jgi:hypothetical protein
MSTMPDVIVHGTRTLERTRPEGQAVAIALGNLVADAGSSCGVLGGTCLAV